MKSHQILIGLSVLLLTICGVIAAQVIWDRAHTLYPTPETESAFLKNYTPLHVIDQFRCNESWSPLEQSGSGAGEKFVTRTGGFDLFFVMRSDKRLPLMTALDNDVYQQLVLNGAQILNRSGDPHSGFQYDYKIGKSIGSLMISPVAIPSPSPIHSSYPLPDGTVDVRVQIEEREMWFPKAPPLPNADQLHELHAISAGTLSW